MLRFAQAALILLYMVLPFATVAVVLLSRGRRGAGAAGAIVSQVLTWAAAAVAAAVFVLAHARLFGGVVKTADVLRVVYFAAGVICLLRVVDRVTLAGAFRLARVRLDPWGRPADPSRARAVLTLFAQRLLMLGLVVPYVVALLVMYRPRSAHPWTPQSVAALNYSHAEFGTTDGLTLRGWWVPAVRAPSLLDADVGGQWGRRTVIVCHGLASAKHRELRLVRFLAENGFNVLAFDFRAHGRSDGMFTSFGNHERHDVLAAARWLTRTHPGRSERIFAVGSNTGAVAVLGAAADPEEGSLIDAVVLFEPFARFQSMARSATKEVLPGPLRWLVNNIGLPIASLHAGTDLADFAPVDLADGVWPRPVLVVHGRGATFVPVGEEMDLYRQSPQPKQQYWPSGNYYEVRRTLNRASHEDRLMSEMLRQWVGTSEKVTDDAGVQQRMLRFLREAEPVPAV